MKLQETIKSLSEIINLADAQLLAMSTCQQNKIEILIGRNADGEGSPPEATGVNFTPNESTKKLILIGGTVKNYAIVTNSKDVYFVMVSFENCTKLPPKSRMLNCKTCF